MQKEEKAGTVATVTDLNNHSIASSNQTAFDVFDYATATTRKQDVCNICNLSSKNREEAELCAECAARSGTLAAALFGHLQQNRKVVRLQRCLSCNGCFAPSKFSQLYGICKTCVSGVRAKSKIARSNFIARTVNNFHKMLKGVAAL